MPRLFQTGYIISKSSILDAYYGTEYISAVGSPKVCATGFTKKRVVFCFCLKLVFVLIYIVSQLVSQRINH